MPAPVTLRNFHDGFVHEAKPTRNFSNTARLKLVGAGATNTMYSFLFWGKPFPAGATITSAKLRVWNVQAWNGTINLALHRISTPWSVNRINWNRQPSITGSAITVTKSNAAARTMWEFDITALIQSVANGGVWYGVRLSANGAAIKNLFSAQAEASAYRPQVIIQWSDAPQPPEDLSPAGGRSVAKPKPLLSYTFTDVSGDTTLDQHQFQFSSHNTFAVVNHDTGWLTTAEPELDMATTSWAGLANEGGTWWRVRVRDGAGIVSGWSAPALFYYRTRGVLNTNSIGSQVTRTNLHTDPDMERVGTGAFGTLGGASIAKGAAYNLDGGNGLQVLTPANGTTDSGVNLLAGGLSLIAGRIYTVSVRVRSLQAQTLVFSPQGAALPAGTRKSEVFAAGETKRIFQTITAFTSGALNWYLLRNDGSVATEYHLDSITINEGLTNSHFSGNMVDSGVMGPYIYNFTGAVNNSTSTETQLFVEDTSPPILWTYTGRTQTAYRAIIQDLSNPDNWVFDSGKVTSTINSIDTVRKIITKKGQAYRLTLYVWDNIEREKNGSDPVPTFLVRDFIYAPGNTVTSPTDLVATPDYPWPWVNLNFKRSTPPDSFTIFRDDEVVENNIDPGELDVGGVNYRYIDKTAAPRVPHTYEVVANVNGKDSRPSNESIATPKPTVTWMMNPDLSSPIALVKSASEPTPVVDAQAMTMQETHQPIGGGSPVLITQFLSGFEGHVDAVLADGVVPVSARVMRNRFKAWKRNPGTVVLLFMVDEVLRIVPYNMTYRPRAKGGETILYDVSFDFFEVD